MVRTICRPVSETLLTLSAETVAKSDMAEMNMTLPLNGMLFTQIDGFPWFTIYGLSYLPHTACRPAGPCLTDHGNAKWRAVQSLLIPAWGFP